MLQKNKLIKKIDEAISNEDTSIANKELLIDIKEELVRAKSEKAYISIVLKILDVIGACAKIFSNSG